MKKLLFFFILMLSPMLASAQTVSDVQNSGCTARARGAEDEELVPTIVLTKEGSILLVEVQNYTSNCFTTDFVVNSSVGEGSDGAPCSLTVNVAPVTGELEANCLCPFNVSFTIHDLEPNSFYLDCWWYKGLVELKEREPLVLEDTFEDVTIDGMNFTLRKAFHHAMLKKSEWVGEVRIPSEVSYQEQTYSVTSIYYDTFMENTNLTKVFIPRTIKNMGFKDEGGIDRNPFARCSALKSIEVEEGNPVLCAVDGALFNKEMTRLYCYPAADTRTSYTVPKSITKIDGSAFASNHHLVSVSLPDNVTSLGTSAFYDCTNLEEVNLPSCLKTLEGWIFGNCQHLKSITIPEGVTHLGINLFNGCTSLASITMPESVKSTDYSVFENCTSLKNVTLSPNLEQINHNMFLNCSSLTNIQIPKSVTSVMSNAFQGCKALKTLDLPENVTRLGDYVFSGCKLDSLFIRGIIDFSWTDHYWLFDGMDTQAKVYVQPSQVDKFKAIYKGPIYPLPEQTIDIAYRPLVEEGKRWTYDNYLDMRPEQYNYYYNYELKGDTVIGGKHCLKMYVENFVHNNKVEYFCALYEEDRRVYRFDVGSDKAVKLYDFNCNVGDSVFVSCGQFKVAEIKNMGNAEYSSRLYRLVSEKEQMEVRWIEGVGSMQDFFEMLPLPGNYSSLVSCELNGEKLYQYVQPDYTSPGYHKMVIEGKTWNHIHYYTDESGMHEEPYSYIVKGDTIIGRTVCKKLYRREGDTERLYSILFESGREVIMMRPGSMGWTLLFDFGRTDFGRVFIWESKQGMGTVCWMPHHVDTISVRGADFRRYVCYQKYQNTTRVPETIEDGEEVWHDLWVEGVGSQDTGIEFQTINHEPLLSSDDYCRFVSCYENEECIFTADDFNTQTAPKPVEDIAYRPFVEEDKVWKVGTISGNPVQVVDYYYFDGDTIINGKSCKQMICQRYISPDYSNEYWTPTPSLTKVGAWYEEDKKVYYYDEQKQSMVIKYDFAINDNDSLQLIDDYPPFIIGPRQTGGIEGFKGVYRDVIINQNVRSTTWLEGVGGIEGPTRNAYPEAVDRLPEFLMSCTVGDEVIYFNDSYEDGATPEEARKKRFDFTHTIKTRPKAPKVKAPMMKEAEVKSLYGEYNDLLLDLHLNPLDDAYQVSITDETGKAVYKKTVNAGNIVGLNIDISAYVKGRYTVTVENSNESFTGKFETQTTGIEEVRNKKVAAKGKMYNLQGQRINSLQKGLNIVNGRKIYVK